MMRRRNTQIAALAATLIACLAVGAAGSAKAGAGVNPCKSSKASKLRHNAGSYVFKLRRRTLSPFGDSVRAGTYACNARSGRWHALARSSRWVVDAAYANGDYVAYTIAAKPISPGVGHPWRLRVMNTVTGEITQEIDFTHGAFVTDFAVGRAGSLAYVSYDFRGGDWYFWVKRRTATGVDVLDRGRGIAEYSLERSWRTITWVADGRRESSTLD